MSEMTSGQLANKLFATRAKIRTLNAKVDILKAEYKELELEAIAHCGAQNINQFRGTKATVSFKVPLIPQAEDWNKIHKYIYQHKALYLLEKRISTVPWREEIEARKGNRPIPGIKAFEKPTISVTVVK